MSKPRQDPCKPGMGGGIWSHRTVIKRIESDGEDSRLDSFFHNLSDAIDIQPHLKWITGVQPAGSHDAEHILAIEYHL